MPGLIHLKPPKSAARLVGGSGVSSTVSVWTRSKKKTAGVSGSLCEALASSRVGNYLQTIVPSVHRSHRDFMLNHIRDVISALTVKIVQSRALVGHRIALFQAQDETQQ